MRKQDVVLGMVVTVKEPVTARYSNYGAKPELTLKPGMQGVVTRILSRMRRRKGMPGTLALVQYTDPATNEREEADVEFANLARWKE